MSARDLYLAKARDPPCFLGPVDALADLLPALDVGAPAGAVIAPALHVDVDAAVAGRDFLQGVDAVAGIVMHGVLDPDRGVLVLEPRLAGVPERDLDQIGLAALAEAVLL